MCRVLVSRLKVNFEGNISQQQFVELTSQEQELWVLEQEVFEWNSRRRDGLK